MLKLTTGLIFLGVALGCSLPPKKQVFRENQLMINQTKVSTKNAQAVLPSTKTAIIRVEGEKTTVDLKLYQYENLLTTYYPPGDFLVESSSSGEGNSVEFIANMGGEKNANAYVHFAFPRFLKTTAQVKKFVNSKNGLIASNGWRVVSRIYNLPYLWAKEKIVFSRSKNIVGEVYIGEHKGKVFYVITHFPVEYGDGFPARADLILQNLFVVDS